MPGTERERIQTICGFCSGLQCVQRHTGLSRDTEIGGINTADAIHARHCNHNGIAGFIRRCPATEAGVATLWHDRHTCGGAKTHNLGHRCGSRRQNNGLRTPLVSPAPIPEIRRLRLS